MTKNEINEKPAAATVLTDERIDKVWQDLHAGSSRWMVEFGYQQFARALEREVLAHAGVTAEPARIPPEIQGMADCMVMVRQELIESGVIDATVAPMFIANAVISKLQEVAALAQVPAAEVRAAALDEAMQLLDMQSGWTEDEAKTVSTCITLLAILKRNPGIVPPAAQQSTADKASEVRAAEKGGA